MAFERSQSCDPVYSQGWIGDGLVAEIIGKEDETRNFFQIVSEHQYHVSLKIVTKDALLVKATYMYNV